MHKNTSSLNKANGNTILEYVLIGVLVLTAGMFAVMAFGTNFEQYLAGMKGDFSEHSKQASYIEAKTQAAAALASISTNESIKGLLNDTNGTKENKKRRATTQTTGASGNLTVAGLGSQMYDNPNSMDSTEEQQLEELIKDLSNHAHKIAQVESMLESVSRYSSGNNTKFQSTSIVFEGKKVNALQLAEALSHKSDAIKQLNRQTQSVLNSSASTTLKEEIATLSDKVKKSAYTTGKKAQRGSEIEEDVAEETHKNAAQICNAGGGKDNGKKCSRNWN